MCLLPVYGMEADEIEERSFGITIRATPEAIEALKQSESPFAGFVISAVVDNVDDAKRHYDDWVNQSLARSRDEEDGHPGYSMEEVTEHLEDHRKKRMIAIAKLQAALSPEELELLGLRFAEE